MDNLNFAGNIYDLRRERGITQETLADFIGVTKASVSKWETGQSLPDIQTLLLLSTYFDVTLDNLLGYRPYLSKEQIRSLYHELAKAFAEKPFDEVFERSRVYVKTYYSCYPFLLQTALLWLNHYMLAAPERQAQVLEEIAVLCARIYENAGDNGLCSDAIMLEATVRLQQGRTAEVIGTLEELCDPYRFSRNGDGLLIQAYLASGEIQKADARVQLCMFEAALSMLTGAVNYLMVHLQELDQCERLMENVDALLASGGPMQLHPNAAAQYQYYAAIIYCTHGRCAEGAARLNGFVELVKKMRQEGMRLQGGGLFDRLEEWFERNALGADAVRNEAVVMESAAQALEHPAFACLPAEELARMKAELVKAADSDQARRL